jgi:hypothetical protein
MREVPTLMSIAVLLIEPVGVRNFVVGPLLRMLPEPPLVLHAFGPEELTSILPFANGTTGNWEQAPLGMGSFARQVLRQTLGYAHMYRADTRSMRFNRNRVIPGPWRARALRRSTKALGKLAATDRGVRTLERAYFQTARLSREYTAFRQVFQERLPAVVFSSTQKAPEALPAVLAARDLGIPTVAFIVSWDNLTTKAHIGAPFDHYFVWGKQMKTDLLEIYPDVQPQQVHVSGTPQFDCYRDPALRWSREQFFARIGADPARPLVCYSGGDIETCPQDQHHLRMLAELVREGAIRRDAQVLLRPSPADDLTRYQATLKDHPEILYSLPRWAAHRVGSRLRRIPLAEDSQLLANLTVHVDVNVNLASTMTLDFAINDTPVVNVAFDVEPPHCARPPLWEHYYQWEHYRPVVELGAARFPRSRAELAEHVQCYLENPTLDREGRRKLVDLQLGVPVGQSSRRLAKLLEEIER